MIFLAKAGIGLMGAVLVGGAAISSEGFIRVKVHEKQHDGTNVSLIVPAAVVPMALEFVPDRQLAQASAKLRPYMPIIEAAIPALEDCADGVLVEVIDPDEHVVVAKVGASIVVDVNDSEENVHVAVPLRAVRASIGEIAAAGGSI
jgi:hypothetical protein